MYTEGGIVRDITVRIYSSFNSTICRAVCVGKEGGIEQSNVGKEPRECAGCVTNMGTWRGIVG